MLGALVSPESPGALQAALSPVPRFPLCPGVPCVLYLPCPGAPCTPVLQQQLLQVHLTWFGDNLASEMKPHFPSPLLWYRKGRCQWVMALVMPLPTLGWSQLPGCAGGKLRQEQLHLTGLFFSGNLQLPS